MSDSLSQTEEAALDHEHSVQITMIDLLGQAVSDQLPNDNCIKILDQLIDYTEAHFMSEQLIMRQHSYEGFDAHDGEHDDLIECLQAIKKRVHSEELTLDAAAVADLRGMLLGHISTQDRQLSAYLHKQ